MSGLKGRENTSFMSREISIFILPKNFERRPKKLPCTLNDSTNLGDYKCLEMIDILVLLFHLDLSIIWPSLVD